MKKFVRKCVRDDEAVTLECAGPVSEQKPFSAADKSYDGDDYVSMRVERNSSFDDSSSDESDFDKTFRVSDG